MKKKPESKPALAPLIPQPPPTQPLLRHQASAMKDRIALALYPILLEQAQDKLGGMESAAHLAYRAAHALMQARAEKVNVD